MLLDAIVLSWVLSVRLLGIGLSHGSRHHWLVSWLLTGVTRLRHENSPGWLRSLVSNYYILMMMLMAELVKESVASHAFADCSNDCYQNEYRYYRSYNHTNVVAAAVIAVIGVTCIAV